VGGGKWVTFTSSFIHRLLHRFFYRPLPAAPLPLCCFLCEGYDDAWSSCPPSRGLPPQPAGERPDPAGPRVYAWYVRYSVLVDVVYRVYFTTVSLHI
jgi:hypothetical protein